MYYESIFHRLFIPLPNTKKNNILVMEALQHITNSILITYKFLVITKTHLSLPLNVGGFISTLLLVIVFW